MATQTLRERLEMKPDLRVKLGLKAGEPDPAKPAPLYDNATVEDAYQQGAIDGINALGNYFRDENGVATNEFLGDDVLDLYAKSALSDVMEDRA